MTEPFAVAVIGAGVVGASVAVRLARRFGEVLVLEKNDRPGQETSSRNSQVIHAGMYYPRGSWKARLCTAGNASLVEYCARRGVPWSRVGKLIVATAPEQEAALERLLAQGVENGVESLTAVDSAFVHHLEPLVKASRALWSPATGIVDAPVLVETLVGEARDHGALFAFRHRVVGAEFRGQWSLRVEAPDGELLTVRARAVVNAAGLHADAVAALTGIDVDAAGYRQHYVKGHYFRLRAPGPLRRLVYPVPNAHLAGLGVHLTVGLDGDLRLGPDVQWLADGREDYGVPESLTEAFVRGAAPFLPWVSAAALSPDQAGIRPKLSRPGEPFRDFVIAEESKRGMPRWVNLVGIESPGLTCALELAREVDSLLEHA